MFSEPCDAHTARRAANRERICISWDVAEGKSTSKLHKLMVVPTRHEVEAGDWRAIDFW